MNPAAHQFACRIIDQPMPSNHAVAGDSVFAGKGDGHDVEFVMPAIPGAGMTGMAMGFIFDGDACRIQRGKSLAQQLNRFATHAGSTFLNGLTVTLA